MLDLKKLLRPHLSSLKPYSSARDEYTGREGVFLDANENPLGSVTTKRYHRYPDPLQQEIKALLSERLDTSIDKIFLGNGSDEPIDLLFRAFCEPGTNEHAIICPPTYGMYQVCADINNVSLNEVPLTTDFQLDVGNLISSVNEYTKLIFLCSPNNPTGNDLSSDDIQKVLMAASDCLVIVDEAYIDFSERQSFVKSLSEFDNLVVMQTFSKSWGLAAIRLGMAFGNEGIIGILNMIKYPYNISEPTQELALEALKSLNRKQSMVEEILENRELLKIELETLRLVQHIYPSEANFFLVKVTDAKALYQYLINQLIIVRDRSNVLLCDNCLRITVGTKDENRLLVESLKNYEG